MDDTQLAEIAACANGDDSVTAQIIRDLLAEVKRRRAEAVADKDDRLVWQRMMAAEAEVTRLRGIVAAVEALPEQWGEPTGHSPAHDLGRRNCADELSRALGGTP